MAYRILHVLSSNFFAGSTAHAITLSEKQASEGHIVFMATDKECKSESFTYIQLNVSNRSFIQRIKNIISLRRIIRKNQIDIVHAHSRAASWISYYALSGFRVALVSTIHGRQVIHSPLKKNNIYGDRIIGICPNLITHLIDELHFDKNKLELIPNGFEAETFRKYHRKRQDNKIIFSFIGRFNGPKGFNISQLILHVFPYLLNEYQSLYIKLYGGEWDFLSPEGKKGFENLKIKYGDHIEYHGFLFNIHPVVADSDLVIGSGRVAIEGLIHGIPVFALGEALNHGMISLSNINDAILTNFGDILSANTLFEPNSLEILKELKYFLNHQQEFRININKFLDIYNFRDVYPKIIQVYKSVIFRKAYHGSIPILMYHKIPDKTIESKHRVFVVKDKFEKHLKFYKFRGLTSITFKDYLEFSNGERPIREFPKKPFILTFDDGYEDNYRNMLPLAQKFGFRGVLFLIGDFTNLNNNWDIGEDSEINRLMTLDQKRAFVESGWEIGAHTYSHCNLTLLPQSQALNEIQKSKSILEEKLQTKIISFAYPFGIYNEEIKSLVMKSGFEFGILTDNGGMSIEDDRYSVFRVNIFPEENLFQLYKKTSNWYREYYMRKRGK